jgi:uncharacterized membrane protein YkoI
MKRPLSVVAAIAASTLALASVAIADAPITGTIPATRAQRAEWPAMAKITLEEAKAIALRDVPGTVDDADLELENGFLVYEVEVDDQAGLEHEFIIDAGSGVVLHKTTDD